MNYEEFVASDNYNAFKDFVSVKQAKEEDIIPEDYHEVFKDTCDCGSDMIISKNRKCIKCCDPRCYIKTGKMLSQLFANFGAKFISDGTTIPLVQEIRRVKQESTHLAALQLNASWVPITLLGAKEDLYWDALDTVFGEKRSFADIVSKLAIPGLDTTARKIFEVYPTVSDLEASAEGDFLKALDCCGIYDPKVAYYLETYLDDIKLAEKIFKSNILINLGEVIDIVITGSVAPDGIAMSRNEFISYLNDLTTLRDGYQLIEFRNCSALQTCNYVIADAPSSSRKYKAGQERGVLITSTEFVNSIKEYMKICSEEVNADE